jgi:hypothetical protein
MAERDRASENIWLDLIHTSNLIEKAHRHLQAKEYGDLWDAVNDARLTLAHVGMTAEWLRDQAVAV